MAEFGIRHKPELKPEMDQRDTAVGLRSNKNSLSLGQYTLRVAIAGGVLSMFASGVGFLLINHADNKLQSQKDDVTERIDDLQDSADALEGNFQDLDVESFNGLGPLQDDVVRFIDDFDEAMVELGFAPGGFDCDALDRSTLSSMAAIENWCRPD